ncbi:TetR/AcrR family transcriptional regulator [Nocardia vinacea]|uniref:TetR/AcrR family transcriptional regulator n=1 Tax=Nocardia vinacea TaxID=96468 RepID=A0ABZ1YM51_9NOCA|nr:TetR/AcrR family transcriptional regulator [Nocardia vinacea]
MANAVKTHDKAPRDRLMAAAQLFYTDGIRAVGVNRLLEEAQTPIMTLYRHFGSKEGLVEAFLLDKDRRVRAKFEREVERAGDTGKERVLAAFDFLGRLTADPEYRGCTFINVAVEMGDQRTFVDIAVAHKNFVREIFARYLTQAGLRQPEPLASQLLILMNGVFVSAQMHSNFRESAAQARMAAEVLLDAALAAEASEHTGPPVAS